MSDVGEGYHVAILTPPIKLTYTNERSKGHHGAIYKPCIRVTVAWVTMAPSIGVIIAWGGHGTIVMPPIEVTLPRAA